MFVPTWLYTVVLVALLATAAIALYSFYRSRRTQRLIVVAIAGLLALGLHHVMVDVIRVSDSGAAHVKWLGTPDFDRVPGGDNFYDEPRTTLVVNDSTHDVRLELVGYGALPSGLGVYGPTVIPPGKMLLTSDVPYIGPDERPPDTITTSDKGELEVLRPWLTW